MEPTREIYWNIVGGVLVYGLALVAIGWLVYGIVRRVRLWRLGEGEGRLDRVPERLRGVLAEIFGHRRQMRDPVPGIAHAMIFYGFLAMVVATAMIAVQEWTGIHYLKGDFYLGYSLVSDLFGLVAIAGILLMVGWRVVAKPERVTSAVGDWLSLGLLLLLFVQGFVVEGIRIAVSELEAHPDWAPWSPVGYVVALGLSGASDDALLATHRFLWWFHAGTAFVFIAWFVFGKLGHVLFGGANVFLRRFDPIGRLTHPDIEALLDEDESAVDRLGIGEIERFSWKSLMDLDACVNCGRCEVVCPATISGSPLSPRKLIQDMKGHLTLVGGRLLAGEEAADRPPLMGTGDDPEAPAPAVLDAELWGCRTCGACMQECPMYIEHIPKIVDMRRHLVMTESRMGDEAQAMLKNLDDRMHPFVGASRDREEWFADLDVKVYGRGDRADLLFWVGCAGAMVDRNIAVSRAMVKVLQAAGVDFALLGNEEVCTGDPARRVGGELTYQMCAKQNIETFEQYGIERIVTTCPHCLNTLRNEYGDLGGRFEVLHHSELISRLIAEGRLAPGRGLEDVTYHDPCYLGRHNDVYDEPRDVVASVARDGSVLELEKSRSRSHCCGSGGGYAWMDDKPEKRINHERFGQIQVSGAKTAALSCPFCMQMFTDASSALDPDGSVRVADIAELVAESLER